MLENVDQIRCDLSCLRKGIDKSRQQLMPEQLKCVVLFVIEIHSFVLKPDCYAFHFLWILYSIFDQILMPTLTLYIRFIIDQQHHF